MPGPRSRRLRRARWAGAALALVLAVASCSDGGDDDASAAPGGDGDTSTAVTVRFCDAYLDYLSDRSPEALADVVAGATTTPVAEQVAELAAIISDSPQTGRVLAADADLDDVARARCQPEWTAGAQGAGNSAAAAAALVDALRAGDSFGARNIASANAIAVFEPWAVPDAPDDIVVVEVGERFFSLVLGEAALAECQVETGVVIACSVTR